MARKTLCTLSTANLLHNVKTIKSKAPKSKILAMVKANGYGHGIRSVSQRLQGHVDALGVASIDEALALRQAGVTTPVTLIEGIFAPDELVLAAEHGFAVVFHSFHQIEWLRTAKLPKPIVAWLKLNTGMGRLGFDSQNGEEALEILSKSAAVEQPVGIVSHFACADEPTHPLNAKQIQTFRAFADGKPGPKSLCNSPGIFAFPEVHYDMVRPGIALYGGAPIVGKSAAEFGLKPVMTFRTELIAIQKFKRGDNVGYGAGYLCPEDMPVGIAAVGYGDGYPRIVRDGASVLIDNERCPIIGRIAMDMAAIDLRACADASVGDHVTLWGDGLPVENLADYCDRISYDLLTGVQNRVRFVWDDSQTGFVKTERLAVVR
ncbi:MAG: alanine racemase [Alphaproteobacteria bacterium]|nr:alanine racemase [Alphaproteobacteria bacterium]